VDKLSPKKWVFPEKSKKISGGENKGKVGTKNDVRGKRTYTFVNLKTLKKFFVCMSDGHSS
jgi:hypothetical protein